MERDLSEYDYEILFIDNHSKDNTQALLRGLCANNKKINLLIYFTDGKGEEKLEIKPRGYKTLWVISGRGEKLSLQEHFGVVKKLSKVEIKQDVIDMSDVRSDGYSMNNQAPIL